MDFLTNPFITALLFLYQYLGQNIVLTIVVFTVVVRLLTYPLTAAQMKSSKSMQELQPRLKKLQEKHKGDREALGREQMKLYQEHGVNPMAGCLPLVIQFPVLIGLYGAISHSMAATPLQFLDLHHRLLLPGLANLIPLQNQFLWLNLGQPDPLYILPVLVVATTYLQSKLMTPPSSGDPKDPSSAMSRQMTLMMPLMIGLFSLQFASGLSIYWVVGNLVSIAQYGAMGKLNLGGLFGRPKAAVTALTPYDDPPSENGASKKLVAETGDGSVKVESTSAKKRRLQAQRAAKAKASRAK
jgi:YidC/Oxa1 family membrane protein insertase